MPNETRDLFKSHIQAIHPYEPGKPIEEVQRELGLKRVIKLASNENPLGTSKKVLKAITEAAKKTHLYPDGSAFYLKTKLSEKIGVSDKQIVIGNGSNEIIEFLIKGFVGEGDKVISSQLSFLVYPLVTQVAGGSFVEVPMKNWKFDLQGILKQIDSRTRLIFIANPNNPTGTYVNRQEFLDFLDRVPKDVFVCMDEAYCEFVEADDFPDAIFYVKLDRPNVVALRTFSKSHGLAGLRLGYGVASEEVVSYLNKIRQPFNVNAIAQAAGVAALDDDEYLAKSKRVVKEGRDYLVREFQNLKLQYLPSQANFILVNVEHDATKVFQSLLKKGIIIRSMKAYGLTNYVRVTVGVGSENRAFIGELKKLLKKIRKGEEI